MNPTGSMSLFFLRRYSDFVGNNHTPITMPCIKTKLITAKTYLKDQQTLVIININHYALSRFY
jgi:hypothetical protein